MEVYLNTEAFRVNSLKSTDDLGVVSLAHHHQEVGLGNKEAVKLLVSSAKWILLNMQLQSKECTIALCCSLYTAVIIYPESILYIPGHPCIFHSLKLDSTIAKR